MKKTRGFLFKCALWLILASVATSCISYKKNLILKNDSEHFPNAELKTPVQAYKLQTNDVVYVEIERLYMGDEAYTIANHLNSRVNGQMMNPYVVGYPIGIDGALQLPLVGEIQAAGMTVDELSEAVTKQAKEVYSTVAVKVFLLTQNVTVIGEVFRGGRFQYYTEQLNVFEAIGLAGGFTDFSDRANVKILRDHGDSTEVFHVNLADLDGFNSNLYRLQNNDVVVINAQRRKRLVTNNNFGIVISSITALITVLSLVISLNSSQ